MNRRSAHSTRKRRIQYKDYTTQEFIEMSKYYDLRRYDSPGVYIFFNLTKNINYVGKSKNVLRRVNEHLNARGNGDLYADYKYGDNFLIRVIRCNINELDYYENFYTRVYRSLTNGYNKTRAAGPIY